MPVALWVLAASLALVDLWAVHRGERRVEVIAKPAAVVAIGTAALASGLLERPWGIVSLIGLAFGLLGDVLLLDGERPSRFLGGLSSFLGGHLLYVAAYVMVGLALGPWLAFAAAVCLACLVASRDVLPRLWRTGERPMAGAAAAYMVVLSAGAFVAALTGRPLVAIGAALFVVSDTMIAVDKFLRPIRHAHVWIMATYLLAQAGVVGGLALA